LIPNLLLLGLQSKFLIAKSIELDDIHNAPGTQGVVWIEWDEEKREKTHPCVPLYFGQIPGFTFSFLSFSFCDDRRRILKEQSLLGNF
jgi:hypothetical protein